MSHGNAGNISAGEKNQNSGAAGNINLKIKREATHVIICFMLWRRA